MKLIAWFKDLHNTDIGVAGGKGASLGEMFNAGLPIPPGFVVTAQAYKKFVIDTKIQSKIVSLLNNLDVEANTALQKASEDIKWLILNTNIPEDIVKTIENSYSSLYIDIDVFKSANEKTLQFIKAGRDLPYVAVRSSATAEDLPEASFAGQQETFLNIKGKDNVVKAVQHCWASLFTARAIYYRVKNNFPHDKVLIAVVVQKMVNSDKAGVMFSVNPSNSNRDELVIEAGWGLGEAVVSGSINPDNYIVDKKTLEPKHIKVMRQSWMFTKDANLGRTVKKTLDERKATSQVLTHEEIIKLADLGKRIEEYYGKPQDLEFAIEGNKIFIVQSRPITTLDKKRDASGDAKIEGEKILSGLGASPGVAHGKVKILHDISELGKIQEGDVLVTKMTNPDYVPAMKKAKAIVTDEGGLTSHAAIVSREMGIVCVVGTEKATEVLKDDDIITVDGFDGIVYKGKVGEERSKSKEDENKNYDPNTPTKTKIYMNLGEPEKIKEYKDLGFDGIGLMRIEFIITDYIKKHPNYMIKEGRSKEYVEKLAEGISEVAKIIHPKPMIVRFSDFKTNEYSNLEGGKEYEPEEHNPMIGWRGVSRYISDDFREAFKLECEAIKKVREKYDNVHVMLPFVRNVSEVKKCLGIMAAEDLYRSNKFKVYLMAEVPAMSFIPEEFSKLDVDGASIGSNDLTQLVLGVDRDSAKLSRMGYFDERNDAVKVAILRLIRGFHKNGKTIGICGQAPSEYDEIVQFLIKNGMDSISINPDVVNKVRNRVAELEKEFKND